jgi:Icc-related predicted phosphoesterase
MFRRRPKPPRETGVKLLFVTDIHGSETVFRKAVNAALKFEVDALVLGGDLTGKIIVPVVEQPDGSFVLEIMGDAVRAATEEELAEHEHTLRMAGQYPFRATEAEVEMLRGDEAARDARFRDAMATSLQGWFDLAAERLADTETEVVVISGNDDPLEIEDVLRGHPFVRCINDDVAELRSGTEILGFGYSNPTPWHSPRELPEHDIRERIAATAARLRDPARSVWNVHVPPHGTALDQAPAITEDLVVITDGGQPRMTSVGSTAVRELMEEMSPALGLHGHVHESRALASVGSTVVANPGSEYTEGVLRAAHVELTERGPRVQFLAG